MKHVQKVILALAMFPGIAVASGRGVPADTLAARLERQLYEFPQEKLHVTTDRTYYFGGDTLWFRTFVADASSHIPVNASKYVYVELSNPFDTLVARVKIKEAGGVYAGHIPLDAQMPEGDYTMTAYTMFMENIDKSYFFRKNIYVSSPYSVQSDIRPVFRWDGDVLRAEVGYVDKRTGVTREFENMSYTTCDNVVHKRMNRGGGLAEFRLEGKELDKACVMITFGGYDKFFRLPSREDAGYDVSFYPEGGYMVPDVECRVAFKAVDRQGLGISVSGTVRDGHGRKVAGINTTHDGMGVFALKPSAGGAYTAEVTAASGTTLSFPLPSVNAKAAVLKVTQNADSLVIHTRGNTPAGSLVIIQQRGKMVASGPVGNVTPLRLRKDRLPAGVAQVMLLDAGANTLSERLVFIRDASGMKTAVSPDKAGYGNRDKVRMSLKLENFSGSGNGSVAVAVTDDKTVPHDSVVSIETQLLLQSDIRGTVACPQYYFDPSNANADTALDMLMMTQGWRRYDIPAVLKGGYTLPDSPLEVGQEVDGIVKSLWRGKPVSGASVSIMAPKVGYSNVAATDGNGFFRFNGFDFPDGTGFIIQAFSDKGKKMMNFEVFGQTFPENAFSLPLASASPPPARDYSEQNTLRINSNMSLRQILLDEVTVIGRKKLEAGSVYSSLATKTFDSKYLYDNRITNLDEVVRLIPGVSLVGDNLLYRGKLVAMSANGFIEEFPDGLPPYREFKDKYGMEVIKSVDFIPSYMATIFGSRATGGGVLNITMKDGSEIKFESPSHFIKVHLPLGYQKPAEFYSPKYDSGAGRSVGSDLRGTVFWLPALTVGEDGTASFEFYSSDVRDTRYTVRIEGLTDSGEIIDGTCGVKIE